MIFIAIICGAYAMVGLLVAAIIWDTVYTYRSDHQHRNRRLTEREKQARLHDAIRKSGGEWFDV